MTPQQVVDKCRPGSSESLQGRLVRLRMCRAGGKEHINSLELVILNAVRWRVERCGHLGQRTLRLTDSLVCLHGLTRVAGPAPDDFAVQWHASTLLSFVPALSLSGHMRRLMPTLPISQVGGGHVSKLSFGTLKRILEGGTEGERAKNCVVNLEVSNSSQCNQLLVGTMTTLWNLRNEIPSCAPPLPEHVVQAMAGWAIFNSWHGFAVSLLVGFYCRLRTGEVLRDSIQPHRVFQPHTPGCHQP